jgi:hypothetical protein
MTAAAGISDAGLRRIWSSWAETASGQNFQAHPRSGIHRKLEDIVGLYLNPPENTRCTGQESYEACMLTSLLDGCRS